MNNLQKVMFNYMEWLQNRAIQSLTLEERGLLNEIQWQAMADDDDGFVLLNDQRCSKAVLARMMCCPMALLEGLLEVELLGLEDGRVFSVSARHYLEIQGGRRRQSKIAGDESAKVRARQRDGNDRSTTVQRPSTEGNEGEERRGEEKKGEQETNKKAKPAPLGPVSLSDESEDITDGVRQVFSRWQDLWALSAKARLTPKRIKRIRKAIQEFGVEGVLLSLEGWRRDKWKERHTLLHNHDLEVLLRTSEKIEAGQAMAGALGTMPKGRGLTDRELHPEDYFAEEDLPPDQFKKFVEVYKKDAVAWIKDYGMPDPPAEEPAEQDAALPW